MLSDNLMLARMQRHGLAGRIPHETKGTIQALVALRRPPGLHRLRTTARRTIKLFTLGRMGHRDDGRYGRVYAAKRNCIRAKIPSGVIEGVFPEGPSCSEIAWQEIFVGLW